MSLLPDRVGLLDAHLPLPVESQALLEPKYATIRHAETQLAVAEKRVRRINDALALLDCVRELKDLRKEISVLKRVIADQRAGIEVVLSCATAHMPGDDVIERINIAQGSDVKPLRKQLTEFTAP